MNFHLMFSILFSFVQHAFIRDVHDMHPLVALVSEATAEVVYEEKDVDEVVSNLIIKILLVEPLFFLVLFSLRSSCIHSM